MSFEKAVLEKITKDAILAIPPEKYREVVDKAALEYLDSEHFSELVGDAIAESDIAYILGDVAAKQLIKVVKNLKF